MIERFILVQQLNFSTYFFLTVEIRFNQQLFVRFGEEANGEFATFVRIQHQEIRCETKDALVTLTCFHRLKFSVLYDDTIRV